MNGRATVVKERNAGTELAADAALGANGIAVIDGGELDQAGRILIDGNVYDYGVNFDIDVALISPPLIAACPEGTTVLQYPLTPERVVYFRTPDQEEELVARVPFDFRDRLPLGIREDPDDAEVIEAELLQGVPVVTDVVGRAPVIDGSYLNSQHDDAPFIIGLAVIGAAYAAADGVITIEPENDCKALAFWGASVLMENPGGFNLEIDTVSSLLVSVDGGPFVQIGEERKAGAHGRWDAGGSHPVIRVPVGGTTVVEMVGGSVYDLAVGAKGVISAGNAVLDGGKTGGVSYVVFGG